MQRNMNWLWFFAGGLIGGLLLSILGGLAGRFIGETSPSGWGDLAGTAVGLLLGGPTGVLGGIAVIGYKRPNRRSLWLAIPGVIGGAALVLLLAEPLRLNTHPQLLWGLFICIPALMTASLLSLYKQ